MVNLYVNNVGKNMIEYRIVYNGLQYKIQALSEVGFLWWKRMEWSDCGRLWPRNSFEPIYYNTKVDAEFALMLANRMSNGVGWEPVE